MSDRDRWERRYAAAAPPRPPSVFVRRAVESMPAGCALDVACGDGRHSIFLARRGFRVDGIDRAEAGLRRIQAIARAERLPIALVQADLEQFPLPRNRYELVVHTRYLQRSLWRALHAAVRPGGTVLFETFLVGQQTCGHPRNPAFLLRPGELREAFADFEILAYSEGLVTDDGDPACLARLHARARRVSL